MPMTFVVRADYRFSGFRRRGEVVAVPSGSDLSRPLRAQADASRAPGNPSADISCETEAHPWKAA